MKTVLERLSKTLIAKLKARKVTTKEVAEQLGVHPTYLSKILAENGITKVKGPTVAARLKRSVLVQTRDEFRKELAKQVKTGKMTYTKAAKRAHCSERTIYRLVSELKNVRK